MNGDYKNISAVLNAMTAARAFFKYLLFAPLALLLLVALAVGWFMSEIRNNLDAPEAAEYSDIRDYAEPAPNPVRASPVRDQQAVLNLQRLAEPPDRFRAWTRWWWPGGDVDAASACDQLADLREAGFGGVEIQPFNAGLAAIEERATQKRINGFGSDEWFSTFAQFMDCADDLDMQVYLNHLSGWPAGGPQVGLEDGLWKLRFGERFVSGGAAKQVDLPLPSPSVQDYLMAVAEQFIGMELSHFAVEQRQLLAVHAAQVRGGHRAGNPLDATDTLELDASSIIVLTDRVERGQLKWRVPEGEWVIIASYLMPSGEAPTLVAAEQPGYVIDHLDLERVRAHYDFAFGSRTGLTRHYGGAFKGFFNDSLEFKLDRLASKDILDAFAARRGYDLVPHLPAVYVDAYDNFFVRDVGRNTSAPSFLIDESDERIRYDYQLTLSDLVIERFAENSMDWAEQRGLVSKGQTYGFEMDTIRALGANHIPETEHLWGSSSELVMKLAGAAGLLYERPVVSAESFVWRKRAYAVTPRHIKAGADLLFLSGVNQVIFHGIPYTSEHEAYKQTFDWLGWYPFQGPGNPSGFSDNYGPSTPTWTALPELNDYIKRSQHILQAGEPSVDVLVYYPFLGFPKSIEDSALAGEELLFAGMLPGDGPRPPKEGGVDMPLIKFLPREKDPRLVWLERLIPTLKALDARGITWSWVNGHALQAGKVHSAHHQAVLVPDVEAMPLESVQALASITAEGLPVYFLGKLANRQPGFSQYAERDEQVAAGVGRLAQGRTVASGAELAAKIQAWLQVDGSSDVRRFSRRGPDANQSHLLVNRSLQAQSARLIPASNIRPARAYWFDAASGALWAAEPTEEGVFELSLMPLESRFLLFTDAELAPSGRSLSVLTEDAELVSMLDGNRIVRTAADTIAVTPGLSMIRKLPYLDGDPVHLLYEMSFVLQADEKRRRYVLDLGRVSGIAHVELNGQRLPLKSFDPFLFDITEAVQPGANRLQVQITPALRNSLVSSKALMDKELEQFEAHLGEAGLAGPVKILRK